jgi:hypothetical protein
VGRIMPIRQLVRDGKPYAYTWGWHGAEYLISKYGKMGAYNKAKAQSIAAHAHGYIDKVSKNACGSQYNYNYDDDIKKKNGNGNGNGNRKPKPLY